MLEEAVDEGHDDIVSWLPNSRAFRIHRREDFAKSILPRYFSTTKIKSFLRQLNIYSFSRVDQVLSSAYGAYWHKLFAPGNPNLCFGMERTKVKSSKKTTRRYDSFHQEVVVELSGSQQECQGGQQDDDISFCDPFDDADWDYPQLRSLRRRGVLEKSSLTATAHARHH
jgi:hypothetical protein